MLEDKYSVKSAAGLMKRRDLDTVCAYELLTMKKEVLETDLLDYKNFIKDIKFE
eukprot:CAMPEP_0168612884 /NCGR_PEP_ID=MMETSP0449_2-20121227/3154_1 /TAXON_ID=1082188 /ORGANISM="Strombidium rassoulzadegani, Strain ras09" /LENGTH=53 /DNA_ID=CAMNT_0008653477 /DNA_START=168 /DNA_END=329 /DNA_ORIENTATION=+